MKTVFKILGFMFYYFSPFVIVYFNHAVFADGGFDVDMLGLIIVLGSFFGLYKYIEKKRKLNEIQDKNKLFIIIWVGVKRLLTMLALYWVLVTVDDNIDKLVLTVQLMSISFVLGFIFSILGNKKKIQ